MGGSTAVQVIFGFAVAITMRVVVFAASHAHRMHQAQWLEGADAPDKSGKCSWVFPYPHLLPLFGYVTAWYTFGVAFSVTFKECTLIESDITYLTMLQFLFGSVVLLLGLPFLGGYDALRELLFRRPVANRPDNGVGPSHRWEWRVCLTATLFVAGTSLTNLALDLLPVGIVHVIKAAEPIVTLLIVWCRGEPPRATGIFFVLCIVSGILLTVGAQEGRLTFLGLMAAIGSNVAIQLRNVFNKDVLQRRAGESIKPYHLLTATFVFGFLLHIPIYLMKLLMSSSPSGGFPAYNVSVALDSPELSYGSYMVILLLPPIFFTMYQMSSLYTLSLIHPTFHAVVNTLRRGIIIGLGAALTGEQLTPLYALGVLIALSGVFGFSVTSGKRDLIQVKSEWFATQPGGSPQHDLEFSHRYEPRHGHEHRAAEAALAAERLRNFETGLECSVLSSTSASIRA